MPTANIAYGEFLPSQPDFENPGCVIANNCFPAANESYAPAPSATETEIAVEGRVVSSMQFFSTIGVSVTVGGTTDSLFIIDADGTPLTSHVPLTPLLGDTEPWQFAQFNNIIVATAPGNVPRYIEDVNNLPDQSGANPTPIWRDLPGDPPTMSRCGRVGDFLMLGDLADNPSQLAWSGLNSPSGPWAPDRLTQAGNLTLDPSFGAIQRIVSGRYASIFQERGIWLLSYVGPPTVWQADLISEDRGTLAPESVVNVGYLTYFLAQDGFFVTNGSEFYPIGNERINRWFFETAEQSELSDVYGFVDFERSAIIWTFKTRVGPTFDRCLVYSWLFDRWSTVEHDLFSPVSTRFPVPNMDSGDLGATNLDTLNISLDSDVFRAREAISALWRVEGDRSVLYYLNGDPLPATWETGEFEVAPAQRVFIDEVYPLIDDESWSAQASLVLQGNRGSERRTPMTPAGASGFCPVRGEGKRIRVRVEQPASFWSDAQGVQLHYTPAGAR